MKYIWLVNSGVGDGGCGYIVHSLTQPLLGVEAASLTVLVVSSCTSMESLLSQYAEISGRLVIDQFFTISDSVLSECKAR